jgi:hypothetical protein
LQDKAVANLARTVWLYYGHLLLTNAFYTYEGVDGLIEKLEKF